MLGGTHHLGAGLLTGAGGGLLAGLFGVGGGLVMVPLLGLFLHLDQHRAQGATLAAMLLPTGLPAVLQYRRRGVAWHWPLVGMLILGFLGGVTLGSLVANGIPSNALRLGFAGLLLILAFKTFRRQEPVGVDRQIEPLCISDGLWTRGLPIGLMGGILSGLTGLGGAVIVIPLLAARFRLSQHEAQLATLMMMLPPIGLPGVLIYAQAQGGLPWDIVVGVALGFAGGAFLGARVATRLPGGRLKQAYAGVMVLMALLVLLRVR